MNAKPIKCRRIAGKPGYVSYVLVLATGGILTMLMIYTYRNAVNTQDVQAKVQLRADYIEKEDTILRALVSIVPNRTIRAMRDDLPNNSVAYRSPPRWDTMFNDAMVLANARTSVSDQVRTSLNISGLKKGNTGDTSYTTTSSIFRSLFGEGTAVSPGINRSQNEGFPPSLTTANWDVIARDGSYPIISDAKIYGTHAAGQVGLPVSTYSRFNRLTYPQINFGYARPGDPFVAKRNWWAFSMNAAANDSSLTKLSKPRRQFVLSIYEVPSQLAISASSFMSLGKFSTGDAWSENVKISGGIFAGKAEVEGETSLSALSSRRGMKLSGGTTIGGQSFTTSPFAPGLRESYQLTQGDFFPVSLASESGRVAFVPINREAEFFDRFTPSNQVLTPNTISPTNWNRYSVGALQCAMQLDITQVVSATDKTPTALRFSYFRGGARVAENFTLTPSSIAGLPESYTEICSDGQTYDFGTQVVDVAYGAPGSFAFQSAVSGAITFNAARFGDPAPDSPKKGYYRPSRPFEVKSLSSGQICVAVYPERFKGFIERRGGDPLSVNHSLVVNVDYSVTGSNLLTPPSIPCTDLDYGLILEECGNLTTFPKGFSLVTNLRTYIGDDFNIVTATPPSDYTPPDGKFYPPCSLFVPERRYGTRLDPLLEIDVSGQVGSLAADTVSSPVRPLDSKSMSGAYLNAGQIKVNLRPITHPVELPPITMMNWLVVLEELRREFRDD